MRNKSMRNKMISIIAIVVLLFGGLFFLVDYKNKQAIKNNENPYGKDKLHQETIDQLDDPLYQNQITPDKLKESLDNKEDVTVYFYSPTCVYCQQTTPELVPLAEDLDVDLKKMNLLEFGSQKFKTTYNIKSTPTLVHYKDGKEIDRVTGSQETELFKAFFETYVAN